MLVLRIFYQKFYNTAQREFQIPALSDDFVPQGFEYCEGNELFLVSGYIHKGEIAQICIVQSDGTYRKKAVLDENGKELVCHSGGISQHDEYSYIAGCDGKCYVLLTSELLNIESDSIKVIGSFSTYNEASFCFIADNYLYVGEYYYFQKYSTDAKHHLITPSGDENNAVVLRFPLEEDLPFGVNTMPDIMISIPGRVQGMCLTDNGMMILSESSIFQGSQLLFYDYTSVLNEAADIFIIDDTEIPLYYVDNDSLLDTVSILPKSEGITLCGNRVYMLFESASNRFQYGKFLDAQYVYSLPMT